MSISVGTRVTVPFAINQTDLLAGTPFEVVAPDDGYIDELASSVQVAVTTGGSLNVKSGAALAVTVAGIVQTIANNATKGTRQTTKSTPGDDTRKVSKGDRVVIVGSGFATAGAVNGYVAFVSAKGTPA